MGRRRIASLAVAIAMGIPLAACTDDDRRPAPTAARRSPTTTTPTTDPSTGPSATGAPTTGAASSPLPTSPMRDLEGRVQADIHLGAAPDWQVAAFGSVWVANDPLSIVQRVDATTNRVVARIHLVPFAKPCAGMAAGFGSMWIPDCSTQDLFRVDPATNRVVARIHTGIADFESSIAVGAGSVWILATPQQLVRVDASTNRVERRIPVPDGSVAATFGHGLVWVTNNADDVVTQVDPTTGSVAGSVGVGHDPRFLASGEGAVWVLNQGDGTVSRIEPATAAVTTIDAGSPGEGGCIATGFGAVWVTVPVYPLTRIDARTGRVTDHFHGPGGDCLSVGSGSVWLSMLHQSSLWRLPAR